MGNELLSTQAIGNYTNTGSTFNPYASTTSGTTQMGSLFGLSSLQPCKDYSNDIMYQDFLKNTGYSMTNPAGSLFGQSQNSTLQQTTTPQTTEQVNPQTTQYQMAYPQFQTQQTYPNFCGLQSQTQQPTSEELAQYYSLLQNQDEQAQEQEQQATPKINAGKKTGVLVGILAPVASSIAKFVKGGTLSLKNLAIKVPVLAVAGWCAGALIDGISNRLASQQQTT